MAEPFSVERRKLMRMLGAKVIVTPKAGKGTGMVRKAEELCAKHGWFLCHQFENEVRCRQALAGLAGSPEQTLLVAPPPARSRLGAAGNQMPMLRPRVCRQRGETLGGGA